MEKVLIFVTRQMCYDSAGFFAKKLAMNMEMQGVQTELCMFAEDDIPGRVRMFAADIAESDGMEVMPQAEQMLEHYVGKKYLAVIDFNSKLPRIALEDGTLFLDSIDAPFYNYILDHPLYHHSMLASPLRDYHVITPDENHAEYVRKFYPHIRSVHVQPLGAAEVRNAPRWQESKPYILFMGTYRDPKVCYEEIKTRPDQPNLPTKKDILSMVEMMEQEPSLTIEQAVDAVFTGNYGMDPKQNPEIFRRWANHSYLAELYIRNLARTSAVTALIDANLPVCIIGDWWEKLPLPQKENVFFEESVDFAKSYRKIAESRVLLNSSPFFYGGMHDRIPAAMANHTVVLTDKNPFLSREFGESDCMHLYEEGDFSGSLVEHAKEALYNEERSRRMENCAFELFDLRYTWFSVAQNVVKYITGERED